MVMYLNSSSKSRISFCVTHSSNPQLLNICLDSIAKHTKLPYEIIISEQFDTKFPHSFTGGEMNITKLLTHNMNKYPWSRVAETMRGHANGDVCVFIEHDAFLLRSIDPFITLVENDFTLFVGAEENIPLPCLDRYNPGMQVQSFFIMNQCPFDDFFTSIETEPTEYGGKDFNYYWEKVTHLKDGSETQKHRNFESAHGVAQSLNPLFLPVLPSGYGYGTTYGSYVHHLWYGSYKERNVERDGVDPVIQGAEAERLIQDYWRGNLKFRCV